MKNKILFIIGLIFFTTVSCEKIFMKPKPKTTPTAIFDEYTKLVREKYGMLTFKQVNINHLSDSLRVFVNDDMTEDSLFNVLGVITRRLKDGHTLLRSYAPVGKELTRVAFFNIGKGYPVSFHQGILDNIYIHAGMTKLSKDRAIYGRLTQDTDIAYLRIASFEVDITDAELETMFTSFSGAKGLIVDVRNNGGGSPNLATKIAAYFTSNEIYIGYENFKVGPSENDFSKSFANLKPSSSSNKFLNPVAVLTDRGVYSATTTFCYSTNPLSNVKFIGQRTGGGSGSVADGYLANGWHWNLSISEFVGVDDAGNEQYLDNGFEPDITVLLDTLVTSQDEIIERAILELQ